MPNMYLCKKNLYVQTDTNAFSIYLAQRNRKNPINIRFPFCVNMGFASGSPGRSPKESRVKTREKSRADEKSNPGGSRK